MKTPALLLIILATILSFTGCGRRGRSSRGPVSLEQVWASDTVLRTPESVLYDSKRNLLYVSNINKVNKTGNDGDGFISRLRPDGQLQDLYWVTGLNDPKGMGLYNDVLYVADLTQIVAISTTSGSILGKYTAEGAKMFNDITVDSLGNVYASDSDGGKLYLLANGRLTVWLDNAKGHRPNGLLVEKDRLLSAWADVGEVKNVNLDKKEYRDWIEGVPSADGIAYVGQNDYLISNWEGEVYYVNASGKQWKILDTKEQKINAADIDFSIATQHVYVPTFFANRVVAYRLHRR